MNSNLNFEILDFWTFGSEFLSSLQAECRAILRFLGFRALFHLALCLVCVVVFGSCGCDLEILSDVYVCVCRRCFKIGALHAEKKENKERERGRSVVPKKNKFHSQNNNKTSNQSITHIHTYIRASTTHSYMNHFPCISKREQEKILYIALFLLSPGLYELDLRIL